ncbi:hypothetical protein MNB_SUP05-6-534 [hydrothermal vent metagenome]|uniref:Lipoprotein n=1 Tax=hydrothermal vent metagenome TaxID=652676 RepID=A0A1W1DKL8_9ZZZZ
MKKTISSISAVVTLAILLFVSGCASTDPTLAGGVKRAGSGIYTIDGISSFNPAVSAVRQCQIDGGTLDIMTTTQVRGMFSGNTYSKLIFKCD